MLDKKYQLFVKEGCIQGQEMIKFLDKSGINKEIIDVGSPTGFLLSQEKSILKLPTAILLDAKNNALNRFISIKEIKDELSIKQI